MSALTATNPCKFYQIAKQIGAVDQMNIGELSDPFSVKAKRRRERQGCQAVFCNRVCWAEPPGQDPAVRMYNIFEV